MRTINSAAGTKNSSAVHYHFGSKLGIIEAVIEKLHNDVRPLFDRVVSDLELRLKQGELHVTDVAMAIHLPFWVLNNQEGYGQDAVKLSARLVQEADEKMQALYNQYMQGPASKIVGLLKALQPDKDDLFLRFQIIQCFLLTISAVATIDLMERTPLGDIRYSNDIQLLVASIQNMSMGLDGPGSDSSYFDMDFWMGYADYF